MVSEKLEVVLYFPKEAAFLISSLPSFIPECLYDKDERKSVNEWGKIYVENGAIRFAYKS